MKPNAVSRSSVQTLTARECQYLFTQQNMGSYQYAMPADAGQPGVSYGERLMALPSHPAGQSPDARKG